MIIFPAIDLYDQKAVRLLRGDYAQMTVYSEDPVKIAEDFKQSGAAYIHLVDLNGAKTGTTPNMELISRIVREKGLFAEVGGGIRTPETVEQYLSAGVSRVILGTAAVENPGFLSEMVQQYGNQIAVGADVRNGRIAVKGWTEDSQVTLRSFLEDALKIGVQNVICTDISKDGAMRGTNLSLYAELSKESGLLITASGGVSTLDDVKNLRKMDLYGAIIGKAYYTGAIDLKEAIEVAR